MSMKFCKNLQKISPKWSACLPNRSCRSHHLFGIAVVKLSSVDPDTALMVNWWHGQYFTPLYLRPEVVRMERRVSIWAHFLPVHATYLDAHVRHRHPSSGFGIAL